MKTKAFTLVEIMIVVAIIGLLAAIAIPNFVRARTQAQENACKNNLRQIDGAIQQWALEKRQGTNSPVTAADIQAYLGRGAGQLPTCPSAGGSSTFELSYTITTAADKPLCNIVPETHKIE